LKRSNVNKSQPVVTKQQIRQ